MENSNTSNNQEAAENSIINDEAQNSSSVSNAAESVETVKSFDDMLKDKIYQSEFDKRIAKALETAKGKWEADYQVKVKEFEDKHNAFVKEYYNYKYETEYEKTVNLACDKYFIHKGLMLGRNDIKEHFRGKPIEEFQKEFDMMCFMAFSVGKQFIDIPKLGSTRGMNIDGNKKLTFSDAIKNVKKIFNN